MNETAAAAAPPHWGWMATTLWSVAIAAAFLATSVIVFALSLGGMAPGPVSDQHIVELTSTGGFFAVGVFATTLVCGPALLGIVKLKRGATLADSLGLKTAGLRESALATAALIVFLVVATAVLSALDRPPVPDFMVRIYTTARPMWMLWIAVVVAAPLAEELFFRGFLLRGFTSSAIGPAGAILLTSLLWTAVHTQYEIYELGFIFLLGCLLGAVRVRTGSVLLTIGLHGLVNLIAMIHAAVYLGQQQPGG